MVHDEKTSLRIILTKDMIFKSNYGWNYENEMPIDETLEKGEIWHGPDAASLLGSAIGSCLCASFVFCLQKRNLSIDNLKAEVDMSFKKNEKGYIRVEKISVNITPKTEDPEVKKRINQCLRKSKDGKPFFEQSCIITPSVEKGIAVSVSVNF